MSGIDNDWMWFIHMHYTCILKSSKKKSIYVLLDIIGLLNNTN